MRIDLPRTRSEPLPRAQVELIRAGCRIRTEIQVNLRECESAGQHLRLFRQVRGRKKSALPTFLRGLAATGPWHTHIDNSLLEGMLTGHNGLILKTAHFMDQGLQAKDAAAKTVLNKIAWYNAVNAHRMLDSLLPAIQNSETRKEMTKTLRFLDTGLTLIGRRFGWNEATTKVMYGKTRSLIEARIEELKKGPLAH